MSMPILIAVAMLAAAWLLVRPRRSGVVDEAASHQTTATRHHQAAAQEVSRLQVELLEQTRELEANLQTRIQLLGRLIGDADERIADLRQQIEFSGRDDFRGRRAA